MIKYLKWLFARNQCEHKRIQCIHGDAILAYNWQRSGCLDCLALFPDLPNICSVTNKPH